MKKSLTTMALVAGLAIAPASFADDHDKKKDGFRSVIGSVVSTKDVDLKGMSVKHTLVKIENKAGKTIVINVGADANIKDIKKGDKVAALGKSARINGKPVLFAKAFGELNSVGRTGKKK